MSSQLIIRGLKAHEFESAQARDAFLSGVKFTDDGLLEKGTDYAKFAGCLNAKLSDGTLLIPRLMQAIVVGSQNRDENDALEAAQDVIVVRPSRTGNAFSFYRGGKHAVSPTCDNVRMIVSNVDAVTDLVASGGEWYYQATPSYQFRRKTQPAKPAAIVRLSKGSWLPKIVASGADADDYAAKHDLQAVNTVNADSDD